MQECPEAWGTLQKDPPFSLLSAASLSRSLPDTYPVDAGRGSHQALAAFLLRLPLE